MVDQSPFAIATAAALPEATPNFAKDLYVANAAHSPEGDLVTIASTSDQNFKKYLTTKEPVDGYGIANIEWSERVGATKVTISKDGNFATLTFNETLLSQRGPNMPSQGAALPMRQWRRCNNPPKADAIQAGRAVLTCPLVVVSGHEEGITRPHSRGVIPRIAEGHDYPRQGRSAPDLTDRPELDWVTRPSRRLRCLLFGQVLRNTGRKCQDVFVRDNGKRNRCPTDPLALA